MIYRFGQFELHSQERVLRRNGRVVAAPSKAMAALLLLVQAEGRVISKEELLTALWPDTFVTEGTLTQTIFLLRRLLAEDPDAPSPIETITRSGYRFRQPVSIVPADPEAEPQPTVAAVLPPSPDIAEVVVEKRNHRVGWRKLLAVGAGAALLAGAVLSLRSGLFAGSARQWTMTQVTTNDSDHRVWAASISPDGRTLAYIDTSGIYLREMDTGRTRQLKGPALNAVRLLWFGDEGRLLLTGFEPGQALPEIWVVSAGGEEARLLRRDASDGAPSPDGSSVAFTADGGQAIRLVKVDGTGERTLAKGSADRVFSALFWSAKGRRVGYQQRVPSGTPATEIEGNYQWSYCSLDLATGRETVLVKDLPFDSAGETASGELFYLRSRPAKDLAHNGLWRVKTNLATGGFLGKPERFDAVGEELANSISVSADGKAVAAVRHRLQPYIFAADVLYPKIGPPGPALTNVRRLTSTLSNDFPYAWTPGSDAVYFESNRVGEKYHLFQQSTGSPNAEMLTVGDNQQFFPTLMPDGRTLVYEEWTTVNGRKERTILKANADGSSAKPVWKEGDLDEWRCPLLTGTSCVLRETAGQSTFTFYTLDLDRGKGQQLAYSPWEPTFLGDWALSPDGSTAAIPSHDPHAPAIRFVSLRGTEGNRELRLKESMLLSEIHWAADAQGFYVEAQIGVKNELQYVDLNGDARLLLPATGNTWGLPSKDGKRLAFADSTISRNVFVWH